MVEGIQNVRMNLDDAEKIDLNKPSIIYNEKMLGIDANYVNSMKQIFFCWRYNLLPINLYRSFSDMGVNTLRLRIFVKDTGTDSLDYAITTAKAVQAEGMKCTITYFLSSDWVDIGKQFPPETWINDYDWYNLSQEKKAEIIKDYTYNSTKYLLSNDIDSDLYEIGNEIDYGICDIFEYNASRRENINWMSNNTWKKMTIYIKAAIEGVKTTDPTSNFILHIAHWWDYNFSYAFFKTMINSDVQLDYLGLSFYPSSGIHNTTEALMGKVNATLSQKRFKINTEQLNMNLDKQIIVSEYAYPSSSIIIGMFSFFNNAVKDYPLTRDGQREWLIDFLRWCNEKSFIAGTFYFSPEFYVYFWAPMALFNIIGIAKPAFDAFNEYK